MFRALQFGAALIALAAIGCVEADAADDGAFSEQAQAARADNAAGDRPADIVPDHCPDVARICEAICDGADVEVPRGCPQPQCLCEDHCPDADRVCEAICDGADIAVPRDCPRPRCDCRPECPDPARICEAICHGEDIDVPRGCPIPGCRCPEPEAPAPVVVRLLWGQLPGALGGREDGDPRARLVDEAAVDHLRAVDARAVPAVRPVPHPTLWAGSARGHGVRVEVLDTVRFEEGDRVSGCRADRALDADRPHRRCTLAEWKTRTTVSHDGLILRFSPIRGMVPRAVVFNLGPLQDIAIPYDKLAELNGLVPLGDRLGNQVSVAAVELGECGAGFIEGLWYGSAPGQGGFAGLWYGYEGTLGGGMQGVYRPDSLAYGVFRRIDGTDIAFGDGNYGGGEFDMTARNVVGEPVASLWGHYGAGFYHGAFAITCGGDDEPRPRPALAEPARRDPNVDAR